MSDWYGAEDDYTSGRAPRGLFDFLAGGGGGGRRGSSGFGEDIGDSLGVVSQILMNLGSGRGGAGVGEAMAGLSERRGKRRDRRELTDMAYRMADKLEPSNPELSEILRSNPFFGMKLLGQKYEQDWRNDAEMSQLREREKLQSQAAIDLEERKQAYKTQLAQQNAKIWGLGDMVPGAATASGGGAAVPTTTLGQGEGEITATPIVAIGEGMVPPPTGGTPKPPVVAPSAGQAEPVSNVLKPRYDYTKGLPDDPQMARILLNQRKKFQDPDMPWESVLQLYKGATNDDQVGIDAFLADVEKRKAIRKREWDFRSEVASPVGPMGPIPETQAILQGAKIPIPPPATDPAAQQVQQGLQDQQAEFLKQAYKSGDNDYQAALKSQLPDDSMGFSVTTNPDGTTNITYGKGGSNKPTEQNIKFNAYYKLAADSMGPLDDATIVDQLTSGYQPIVEGVLPEAISNFVSTDEFLLGKTAAKSFIAAVLRAHSGATVTPHEEDLYGRIFIPRYGEKEKPATIAFKKQLRESALQGIADGRSPQQILQDGYKKMGEFKAKESGGEKVIPPMEPWAKKAGITQEQWNKGTPELWFPDLGEPKE